MEGGKAIQIHVSDLPAGKPISASRFAGTKQKVLWIINWSSEETFAIGSANGVVVE